ncbi:hypothetical protein WG66_009525 [Moniliophthora roreri]|nr:hypothetical protein WG66_009525 [Moniliophthora roreri]
MHKARLPVLPTHSVLHNTRLTSLEIERTLHIPFSLLSLPTLRVLKLSWDADIARAFGTWIRGSPITRGGQLREVASETGHRSLPPLEEVHIEARAAREERQAMNCNLWLFLRACSASLQSIRTNDYGSIFLYGPPVSFPNLHTYIGTSCLGDMFGTQIFKGNSSLRVVKFNDEPYGDILLRVFGYNSDPPTPPYGIRKLEIRNLDEFDQYLNGFPDFLRDMFPNLEEFYCGPSTSIHWDEEFFTNLGSTHLSKMTKLRRFVIHPCNEPDIDEWKPDIGTLIRQWGKCAPALRVVSLARHYEWERASSDAEWVEWELEWKYTTFY